jgi:hypothetical protein
MNLAAKDVGPAARAQLASLLRHYASKPHPFSTCVRDNTKRWGKETAERRCSVIKDLIVGNTNWRGKGK